MNYWKWGGIAVVIIVMFFLGRCNGIRSVTKHTGRDTTIYRDTVTVGGYVPALVFVAYQKDTGKTRTIYDTLWGAPEVIIDPADTAAILEDYHATKVYSDTQKLKRGQVIIDDTVSRNRITGRGLTVTGVDTTITVTTVLKPPRRTVGYFTLSAAGNKTQSLGGAGAGFALKVPNETVYQVEYKILQDRRPMLEARIMLPIRLIKRK